MAPSWLIGLFALAAGLAFAASTPDTANYGVDFWREPEGLPQSRIRAVVQTHDGYLWLGTDGGLVRFNGNSFKTFTTRNSTLKDAEVWALREDNEHALWVGTYGGGVTRLKDGRFQTFTTADGLADDIVTRIEKDSAGDIWIATAGGFNRYSHGAFTRIPSPGLPPLSGRDVFCACSPDGVYVALGNQLLRFNGSRFAPVAGAARNTSPAIERLACGRDGAVWIGRVGGVIEQWKSGKLERFPTPFQPPAPVSLLHVDGEGNVWAASGRSIFRLRNGRFEPVQLAEGAPGLSVIYGLHIDREGSIWVGQQANGLARLRVRPISTLPTPAGVPDEIARCVFQDRAGDVWMGMSNGLARYRGGKLISFTALAAGYAGPVRSLAEDANGRLWVGVGKNLMTFAGGALTPFRGWQPSSAITVIYRDAAGKMWVGTDWDGLYEADGERFRNYRTQDGLGGNRIRALLRDRNGALWISSMGVGVTRMKDGAFTRFGTAQGLAGTRVYTIHEDEQGTLWFATRGGLTRLKNGAFFSYASAPGLMGDFIYSILDDGLGNFWFSTAQGLLRVARRELADYADGRARKINPVSYGVRDGMRTRACNVGNQPVAWRAADGKLLFGSLQGVVVVPPGRLNTSAYLPPVHIEAVTVNRRAQPLDRAADVPVGPGEVQIDYAALSYLNPEKVRYKYMLVGHDSDWVDAGDRTFAFYANLPPGDFNFRVIAGSVDGQWNQDGASFGFHLQPRFYQTRLFWGAMLSLALLVAWLFYRLRIHEVRARYSAVLDERHRISQDIHDTFAQNLAGIALQLDSVKMQLEEIPPGVRSRLDEACNLTRYSLAEARRTLADLRSDEFDEIELDNALPQVVARLAGASGVETQVHVSGHGKPMHPLRRKALIRVLQEALANALKHAGAHKIDVDLRYDDTGLVLGVRDDGCGFDAGRAIPLSVGHYGLTGMRERVERIGGRMKLDSAPGQGTQLQFHVPFAD